MSVDTAPPAAGETATDVASPEPAPRVPSRSLSPSRASDFMSCPLRYRFRVIDRLPEAPSPAAARGTLVHAVLDELFGLPAEQRTVPAAEAMLGPAWEQLLAEEPQLGEMFPDGAGLDDWFAGARTLLAAYF